MTGEATTVALALLSHTPLRVGSTWRVGVCMEGRKVESERHYYRISDRDIHQLRNRLTVIRAHAKMAHRGLLRGTSQEVAPALARLVAVDALIAQLSYEFDPPQQWRARDDGQHNDQSE